MAFHAQSFCQRQQSICHCKSRVQADELYTNTKTNKNKDTKTNTYTNAHTNTNIMFDQEGVLETNLFPPRTGFSQGVKPTLVIALLTQLK